MPGKEIMAQTQHVGAGVPKSRLPDFRSDAMPSQTVLSVLRVALERASMKSTGFLECEVAAAKAWVQNARPAQPNTQGQRLESAGPQSSTVRKTQDD